MAKYDRGGNRRRKNNGLLIAVIVLAVLLVLLVAAVVLMESNAIGNAPTTEATGQFTPVNPTENNPTSNTAPSIGFIDDPTTAPSEQPTEAPTTEPTAAPTEVPTSEPTVEPTDAPATDPTSAPTEPTTQPPTEAPTAPPTDPPTSPTEPDLTMERGLEITDIGWYTGEYLEDGSNESVENILMVVVTNHGDEDIQYAEIQLMVDGTPASFVVTTLPAGDSMILLEQNRMPFKAGAAYTDAVANNVAVFKAPMNTHSDVLKIQGLNGAVNVTNISGKDIEGDIVIYYKNVYGDTMYGGITYRITISGGLKAGQIRQVMTKHFITDVSRIMFVTIDGQ